MPVNDALKEGMKCWLKYVAINAMPALVRTNGSPVYLLT
jgi:hypothetical protein